MLAEFGVVRVSELVGTVSGRIATDMPDHAPVYTRQRADGFALPRLVVMTCLALFVSIILPFVGQQAGLGFGHAQAQADYDYYYWDDDSSGAAVPAPQQQQRQQQPQAQQQRPAQQSPTAPTAQQPYPQQQRTTGGPDFSQAGSDEYRLGSGDQLRLTVFGHDDLSGQFEVDGTGYASFPLIGQMQVSGYTTKQVEAMVQAALSPNYLRNPRVGVEVLNYRPFYILGEVAKPGSYPFVSGMRLINAVALAGGYTYRAQKKGVKIERAVNGEMESADHNSIVLPGDIVHVPERFF